MLFPDLLLISIPVATAIGYFIVFHIYWLGGHAWTHPARWWHELSESEQAAWFGAVGTVSAIVGTFWLARWQYSSQTRRAAEAVAVLLAKLNGSREAFESHLERMKASANVDHTQLSYMQTEGRRFMERIHRLDTSISILGLSPVNAAFTVEDELTDLLSFLSDEKYWEKQWPMNFVFGSHPVFEYNGRLAKAIKEAQRILASFQ